MAQPKNPFADFDFTKFFDAAKVPGVDMESLVAAQKKNVEAMIGANQIMAEGVQAVFRRQAEVAQSAAQEFQNHAGAMMACASNEERFAKQAAFAKAGFEQSAQAGTEIADLFRKSQTEAFDVLKRRVAEGMDEIKDRKAA